MLFTGKQGTVRSGGIPADPIEEEGTTLRPRGNGGPAGTSLPLNARTGGQSSLLFISPQHYTEIVRSCQIRFSKKPRPLLMYVRFARITGAVWVVA